MPISRIAALAALCGCLVLAAGQTWAQQGRMTGLTLSGDQPIQIESDRLEVREADSIAVFTGNVSVVQGDTLMRSGSMTVHYSGGRGATAGGTGDIERIEVDGGVHMRSREQVATGDRGSFDMRGEVLVLTGSEVVLTEGDNVIVGCRLTVQMATGLARLDGCPGSGGSGRVKMLLQPGSQNR